MIRAMIHITVVSTVLWRYTGLRVKVYTQSVSVFFNFVYRARLMCALLS